MIIQSVRGLIVGILLYGVYLETGVWTTIALFLIFLAQEVPVAFRRHPGLALKLGTGLNRTGRAG